MRARGPGFSRKSWLVTAAVWGASGLLVTLAGCGAPEAPDARGTFAARSSPRAVSYVPAAATCGTMPGPTEIAPAPVASVPTHVSGYRICGPFTATRGTSSFDCPLPSGAAGPLRLLVRNGNADGSGRASSAFVRVNGVDALGPRSFDNLIGAATARVQLAATNTVEVGIHDAGGTVRVEIVDEGQTCRVFGPAAVTRTGLDAILSAPSGLAAAELQLFNGGLDGASPANRGEVLFNGRPVVARREVREKVTAVLVPLSLGAPNALSARAGEEGLFALQVVDRDELAPQLTISAPADGAFTNQAQVSISGSVDDPSATVTVNGSIATVVAGRYSVLVNLAECWNTVTVAASDGCTNASEARIRIGLDTTPPVLGIVEPAEGLLTTQPAVSVFVRYSDEFSSLDGSSVRISLDGADVTGSLSVGAEAAAGTLLVTEGRHTLEVQLSDRAGNVAVRSSSFTVDYTAPALAIAAPQEGGTVSQSSVPVTVTYGDTVSGVDPSTFAASLDGQNATGSFAVGPIASSATLSLSAGLHQLAVQVSDLAGNVALATSSFVVATGGGLPPDPATVAPPVDPSVATDIASATAFLYSGPSPIQTGVAPGTIEARRVAVIRGQVNGLDGNPIGGVQVTILDHPELGSTLTRADGGFDMAVNGGGLLTVSYQKDGYLPAQRQVQAPWRDYVGADEVVLVAFDAQVTPVALGASSAQVARGSPVNDADGTRQATLIFPAGTTASMVLPDGTSQSLANLHVRATEYTVGPSGPKAMPAALPPTSAYTYAVELSVDEAVMAGATTIQFNQPVAFYVENFLGFQIGGTVPVGYYDRVRGVWVPSDDGRVVKILGVTGGLADLDTDGDGTADDEATLTALGVTVEERSRLAALYQPGTSLWRVQMTHFSPWDCNWPFGCDGADCPAPDPEPPPNPEPEPHPECESGSIIDCQNQGLGETVPVTGTPFSLHYSSTRVPGRAAERTLTIPLSGATVPSNVLSLELSIEIAGRTIRQSLPPLPNQRYVFSWDGKDVYGRQVQGITPAKIVVGWSYKSVYLAPSARSGRRSFAAMSSGRGGGGGAVFVPVPTRDTATPFWRIQVWELPLSARDARPSGLAGWTLDIHHSYDPRGVVNLGDGSTQTAPTTSLSTVAQNSSRQTTAGGIFEMANFQPMGIAFDPGGSLLVADWWGRRIRKLDAASGITNVAGAGCVPGAPVTEGGPASKACMTPMDVAVAPDGTIYVADFYGRRVWRVDRGGRIWTFAGGGSATPGDGGLATQAQLGTTSSVAVAADGAVLILESDRLRRVGTDGTITTIGGPGSSAADNIPATQAWMPNSGYYPKVSVGRDGSIFVPSSPFATGAPTRVRRIGADGIIRAFAGTNVNGFGGDGGPGLLAQLNKPHGAWPLADGSTLIADSANCRVRLSTPDGLIRTIAGSGTCGFAGDRGSALNAAMNYVWMAARGPDGSLYIVDTYNYRIRKVASDGTGYLVGETLVPSSDGTELFDFDASGRHQRTLDARTGAVHYSFAYDPAGRLSSITDRGGNVSRIERDTTGRPTAIVAPFGQQTALSVDGNGYLAGIANPAGEMMAFTYDGGGLMQTLTDPRSSVHVFSHDPLGRLARDENPAGGVKALARTEAERSYSVTITTALGRATGRSVESLTTGDRRRVTTEPDGTVRSEQIAKSGLTTATGADGTVVTTSLGPDPRFGMMAPVRSVTTRTPGGRVRVASAARTAALADPSNVLSVTSLGETLTVNGRAYSATYATATRTLTRKTPAGRTVVSILDDKGRVARLQPPGQLETQLLYDASGRLTSMAQGARVLTVGYDAQGYAQTLTDALMRTAVLTYDPAGRVRTQTLPGNRTVGFSYDASGNLTSLTPPGRPSHGFGYTANDLTASYTPPSAEGTGTASTSYTYDLDGALSQVLLADSTTIVPGYDGAGRLTSVTTARGTTSYGYDGAGRVQAVGTPEGAWVTFGYDGFLPTSETATGLAPGVVSRTYDNDFRVATTSVNGSAVAYQYDADSLLTGAGALAIVREAATGRVSSTSLGTVSTSQSYDGSYGELSGFSASTGGTTPYSYSLTHDLAGRITAKTETVHGVTDTYGYVYDDAGRLATVTKNGSQTASYVYDANGNRVSATTVAGTEAGTYDDQDRMATYGAAAYTYGPSGDLRTRTVGGQTTTWSYDALGNLLGAWLPDGRSVEYVVDGLNRRVGKKVNGVLVEGFLYDGQLRPAAWLDGAGNVYARFVYGTRVNVPEYMVVGSTSYRIITDHLGSPRLVVNATTGAIAQRVDYDEWGQVLADSSPGFQPFGFAGGLYDRDTGLVRFGARDYDPSTGRWTNKDPVRFAGGLNLYAYAAGDPVNRVDRNGLDANNPEEWETEITFGYEQTINDMLSAAAQFWTWAAELVANAVGGAAVEGVLAPVQVGGMCSVATPTRILSSRVLLRSAEEIGPNHNFPAWIMEQALANGTRTEVSSTYAQYAIDGLLNGAPVSYEVGVEAHGAAELITHLFARPY